MPSRNPFSLYSGDSRIETFGSIPIVSAIADGVKLFFGSSTGTVTNLGELAVFGEESNDLPVYDSVTMTAPITVERARPDTQIELRPWSLPKIGAVFIAWKTHRMDGYSPYGVYEPDTDRIFLDNPPSPSLAALDDLDPDVQYALQKRFVELAPNNVPNHTGAIIHQDDSRLIPPVQSGVHGTSVHTGSVFRIGISDTELTVQPWRPENSQAIYLAWVHEANPAVGSPFGVLHGSILLLGPRDADDPVINSIPGLRVTDSHRLSETIGQLRDE